MSYFANAVPGTAGARTQIEKYLKAGAIGIGEQKYKVACDSPPMQEIFQIAQDHQIPVILHFQHDAFNTGIERFYRMVEKYPESEIHRSRADMVGQYRSQSSAGRNVSEG